MKISEGIHVVGGGRHGFGMSNKFDCQIYLLENPGGHVLIDAGVGLEVDRIINNIKNDGINLNDIKHLFITHVHSDHAGGCAELKKRLGLKVYISKVEAPILRTGDEIKLSLDIAKRDGFYPQDYVFHGCEPDVELNGGEKFTFDAFTMETIHVPGHSPGSMCFLVKWNVDDKVEIPDDRSFGNLLNIVRENEALKRAEALGLDTSKEVQKAEVKIGKRVCLFPGDVLVQGGKLMFQNCIGCDMADMRRSMPKLANLGVQELYPGHYCFLLSEGQNHIDAAIEGLRHLVPPPNAL
ncbi:MAG: MBL fold metallo-hydrolase [Candidatus Latescibacter sp.]|nr:MBL fold metallo-hydrolase [Candidatus Latescibacter sp.]